MSRARRRRRLKAQARERKRCAYWQGQARLLGRHSSRWLDGLVESRIKQLEQLREATAEPGSAPALRVQMEAITRRLGHLVVRERW